MPLGMSWPRYLTFLSVSLTTMFLGAQVVHEMYKPLSMPLGMSWPRYLTFLSVSLTTMFLGAQVVHEMYKPLSDFPEYIEREREKALQQRSSENN